MTTATDIRARYAAALAAARVVREEAQTELDAHLTAVAELQALLAELDGHSEPTGALQSLDAGRNGSRRSTSAAPVSAFFSPEEIDRALAASFGHTAAAYDACEPTPAAVLDAKLAEAIDSTGPRWDRMRKGGASDMELAEVIRHRFVAIGSNVNGTSDWSCATSERGGLRFWDTRTGRKSRHRPTLAGAALVVAARMILGIPKPGEGCTA